MAKLPPATWAALWVKNGGLPSKTRAAVATVMCESNGDTSATSPVGARGGWQFMPGTLASDSCARDPDCSTREAVKLSNRGRDFSAWDCHPDSRARSGYDTGDATYERIFAELKTPLGDIPLPGPDLDFTNPLGPLNPINPLEGVPGIPGVGGGGSLQDFLALPAFFKGLGELILTPEGWLRIAKLGGGALLLIWGLRVIVKQSTGTDPIGTAKKAGEAVGMAVAAKKLPV